MPKVSIVIPVYNSEAYLDRCLQSVLGQSEPDWECILVDDGSKDDSGKRCDEYAEKDCRFKVFHRTNHGPSSSRNYGLDNAQGEYLCFIDSDDYVAPDYLKHLVEPMIQDKSIGMTVTGMQKFGSSKGRYPKEPLNATISSKKAFNDMLGGTNVSIKGWLWNKCIRKHLLNDYRMREDLRYCEDLEMLLRMLYEYPDFKVKQVGEYDYYYFVQKPGNSLSHNVSNKVVMMDEFAKYIERYPDSHYKRMRIVRNAYNQCRSLASVVMLNDQDKRRVKNARRVFVKNIRIVSSKFNRKDIMQIAAIILSFTLYKKVIKFFH